MDGIQVAEDSAACVGHNNEYLGSTEGQEISLLPEHI
jgi:hypothetical protein